MEPTVGRARGLASVLAAAAMLLGGMTLLGDPLAAVFDRGPAAARGASGGEDDGFPGTAVLGGLLVFGLCQRHALLGADPFRAADAVTLLRTTLLGLFVAVLIRLLLAETTSSEPLVLDWPAVALAAVILLLDGVDDAVARACGGGTTAGRRYDDVADAVVLFVIAAAARGLLVWWAVLLVAVSVGRDIADLERRAVGPGHG